MSKTPADKKQADRAAHFLQTDVKAYLDGELTGPRLWAVRWHLARCADCREEMVWLRRLGEDMRDLERAVPRPELRARIMANLPETPPTLQSAPFPALPQKPPVFGRPAFRLAMGGAMALLAFGAFALSRSGFFAPKAADSAVLVPRVVPPVRVSVPNSTPQKSSDMVAVRSLPQTKPDEGDAINRRADELFRKEMEQQIRTGKLPTKPPKPAKAPAAPLPDYRLTLPGESDAVTGLRLHLRELVQRLGGKAEIPAEVLNPNTPLRETVLVLRLPKDRTTDALNALRQYGTMEKRVTPAKAAKMTFAPEEENPQAAPKPAVPLPNKDAEPTLTTLRIVLRVKPTK